MAKARKKAGKKTSKKAVGKKTAKKRAVKATARKVVSKKAVKKTAKKAAKKSSKKPAPRAAAVRKVVKKVAKKVATKTTKKPARKVAKKVTRKRTAATVATTLDASIHGIAPYRAKKGEEYMNEAQLDHFRAILQTWRENLISEIDRTIHTMQDETINHPDPNDRATQETDMSLELRSRDRERKLIKKIDDTLDLIDADEYGYCDKCGVEIGVARLEARPTATLCIDCKTLDEIREKQMI